MVFPLSLQLSYFVLRTFLVHITALIISSTFDDIISMLSINKWGFGTIKCFQLRDSRESDIVF